LILLLVESKASNRSTNVKAAQLQPSSKALASVLLATVTAAHVHNKMLVQCRGLVFILKLVFKLRLVTVDSDVQVALNIPLRSIF